ncbi:sigma-70 family RNA polymerase sigma factor [soil metagenome]
MSYEQALLPFAKFTSGQLLEGCQQSRPDNSHEPFCFELFRRAIVEKSEQCWAALYQQYKNLVYSWIIQFAKTTNQIGDISSEEMVLDAFTAFWRAFTTEKLNNADRLASILAYLKSCAVTSVLQARRKAENIRVEMAWDEELVEHKTVAIQAKTGAEFTVLHQLSADRLWSIVDHCCHDEKDRIVARLSLVANLKPRLILEHHPELFTDVAEIYALSRNLKNRLGRDETLRSLWGEFIT